MYLQVKSDGLPELSLRSFPDSEGIGLELPRSGQSFGASLSFFESGFHDFAMLCFFFWVSGDCTDKDPHA